MQRLLVTENYVVEKLKSIPAFQEKTWIASKLRPILQHFDHFHSISQKHGDKFLSNPVNAYLLIKRLSADWRMLQNITIDSKYTNLAEQILEDQDEEVTISFPSWNDFTGKHLHLP